MTAADGADPDGADPDGAEPDGAEPEEAEGPGEAATPDDPPGTAEAASPALRTVGQPPGYETWNLVTVVDVSMRLPAANPEVVLQESAAPWRELRIPVGLAEGNAIAHALRDVPTPRPLTHALVADLLERHGIEVEAARITTRTRRLFGAELDTVGPTGRHVVACRPSDAIAVILRRRMPTPLLVAEWVFDNAADDPAG